MLRAMMAFFSPPQASGIPESHSAGWRRRLRPGPRAWAAHLASSCLLSPVLRSRAPGLTPPRQRSRSRSRTHAKGQQQDVEQELDTSHSSFHRHGCSTWGSRGRRGREAWNRPRGDFGFPAPCRPSRPSLPGPHSWTLPPGNPAVRSTSPSPLSAPAAGWAPRGPLPPPRAGALGALGQIQGQRPGARGRRRPSAPATRGAQAVR